jgi:uncharacterized LabA/DUF88 family protein
MLKKVIAFVDGENLVCRFQDMKAGGRVPKPEVIYDTDTFVWVPELTRWSNMDLIRVLYYTSAIGDSAKVAAIEGKIASTRFICSSKDYTGSAKVIPRVHKKLANSRKSKVVDIDIAIDVMRAVVEMPIDAIYLLSGDGDYLSLVREVTRSSKQVFLGAFSSGLAAELPKNVEQFIDLDPMFFT